MREYSPKRRTALVFTGSGSSGAYHAGALKALDESGVKLDLVVGSGVGTLAAAFAAVAGGARLYGKGGFWDGLGWSSLYRLRTPLYVFAVLLVAAFVIFLLPLALATLGGLLFPLALIVDLLAPGWPARTFAGVQAAPAALRAPYLAALAAPVFALSVIALVTLVRLVLRDRRRVGELFESVLDASPAGARLRRGLWEVARGVALSGPVPSPAELGRRYTALAFENLGQPGFRELILRSADLETGRALPFLLLQDASRASFATALLRDRRAPVDGLVEAVDLRTPEHAVLLFDAVLSGLLPAPILPPLRVEFPRGGVFPGETHRLAESGLVAGSGVREALDAGAEQIILVSASPEQTGLRPRRRGGRALFDAALAAQERQALESDLLTAERQNRMVQTLGHAGEDGRRAWQDPATGRVAREFSLYVIRPTARALGPLELDAEIDPATEVAQTLSDLMEQGYRDAYRLFVEPVVGAAPEPAPALSSADAEPHEVTL
jgi:hypothetical protein